MNQIEVVNVNQLFAGLYTQAFYIGRPSPLGNPYGVKEFGREGAVDNFYSYLKREEALGAALSPAWAEVERIVETIVAHPGGNYALSCFCAPLRCHGDVVLRAVVFNVWRRLEAVGSGYADVWKPNF